MIYLFLEYEQQRMTSTEQMVDYKGKETLTNTKESTTTLPRKDKQQLIDRITKALTEKGFAVYTVRQ